MSAVTFLDADMTIFEIDGLPYIDADWLERRIYCDDNRRKRWLQEARRLEASRAVRTAYLWQALQATYRVEKWRRNLALTQAAIIGLQRSARAYFGLLVRTRRVTAGLSLNGLARLAGLDGKTIANIERAGFAVSRRSIEALVYVSDLHLSWCDVSQELLEDNPADGRKHRAKRATEQNIRIDSPHVVFESGGLRPD